MTKYSFLTKEFLYTEHWINKKSLAQIARETNIAKGSMSHVMKHFKVKIRSSTESNKLFFYKNIDEKTLFELYVNKKLTIYDIAKKLGVGSTTIWKRLCKFNIPINKRIPWNKNTGKSKGFTIEKCVCKDCAKPISRSTYLHGGGRCRSCARKGKLNHFFNKNHSDATRRRLSLVHGGTGKPASYKDYCGKFTIKIKRDIRTRDGFKCQLCNMTEAVHLAKCHRVLDVHHIDYDKTNNTENNLITLCGKCHHNTNYNRDFWYEMLKT